MGGIIQLVATGDQDVYLTGDPQITFFKAIYKRHTNFSMECIEQKIAGGIGNNGKATITLSKSGDLVQEMFLEAVTGNHADYGQNKCVSHGTNDFVVCPFDRRSTN